MTIAEIALNHRKEGRNCAQAVLLAYSEEAKRDPILLAMLSEGLGTGMANMQGSCGALVAAAILNGLLNSEYPSLSSKALVASNSRLLVNKFMEKNGAIKCEELKGVKTGNPLASCEQCITVACELIDEYLLNNIF